MTFNPDSIKLSSQEKVNKVEVLLALKKLEEKFHFKRVSPEEFISDDFGYTEEDVKNDMQVLEQKRGQYEKLSSELELQKAKAELLERVIIVGITKLKWFGDKAEAFLTSEYDDEINYIDGLVKFTPPNSDEFYRLLGLNFDATFTTNMESIGTKMFALRADLDRYNIPKAKYFKNPATGVNGVQLPKVILGCDSESINKIIKMINTDNFDDLAKDPIQDKLLLQSQKQLGEFKDRFARSSTYHKHALEKARMDKESEDTISELDLNHRKFSNLFDMHSQVFGLVNAACRQKGIYVLSQQQEFFSDAVHQKIMMTADQINPKKK